MQHSVLEKVEAVRAILAIAKSVQEKHPDREVRDVMLALKAAVLTKRENLKKKPYLSLSETQKKTLFTLDTASYYLEDIASLLCDEATTRTLDGDEREQLAKLQVEKSEKAKAAAAKRKKAEKPKADAGQIDAFADAE